MSRRAAIIAFCEEGQTTRRTVSVAIALVVWLSGCGKSSVPSVGSSSTAKQVGQQAVVLAGTHGSVALQRATEVPLGLTAQQVEGRLGSPAVPLHRKDANYSCMFYEIIGQPPTVQLQYCFSAGKLRVIASYIGR